MAHPLSFQKHRLHNGLTVYWQRRPAMPWISACVCARAGYRYAPPGAYHIPHLLEHVMFCGTEGYDYPRHDFTKFVSWGVESDLVLDNASTNEELVTSEGQAPLTAADPLLRLLAAFMLKPTLTVGLDKEREIVRAERNWTEPGRCREYEREMAAATLGGHPAATYSLWPEDRELDSYGWGLLREHHARTFHPRNMSLVAVAGEPFRAWRDRLEEFFVPTDDEPLVRLPGSNPAASAVTGQQLIRAPLERRHRVTTHLEYRWILPPGPWPNLNLATDMLATLLTSRIREKMRATYSITVTADYHLDYVSVKIETALAKKHAARARSLIEQALTDRRALYAVADPEIAQSRLKRAMPDLSVETAMGRAWNYVVVDLDPPRPNALAKDEDSFDGDAFVALVGEHLDLDRCVVGIYEADE